MLLALLKIDLIISFTLFNHIFVVSEFGFIEHVTSTTFHTLLSDYKLYLFIIFILNLVCDFFGNIGIFNF